VSAAQAGERPARSRLLRSAVDLLSRRDFSRAELRARLLRLCRADESEAPSEVESVLDAMEAQGLLSEQRFVEGFVRTRAARFGPARLRHELLRRGIPEDRIEAALKLHQRDEYAAARALWEKRFKSVPADRREWAHQARFLAARGFSHEVIRRVLEER
jgi:regulatory protein